jgi:hypothetical protein
MIHKNHLDIQEKTTQEDARWFEKHPNRSYRIRKYVAGEMARAATTPPWGRWDRWTLVKQLAPGVRARLVVHAPSGFVPYDTDENIAELFDYALDQPPLDQQFGVNSPGGQMAFRCFLPLSPTTGGAP